MLRRLLPMLLAVVGWAAGQCDVAPGANLDNLALEGFGSVTFGFLRFDQAADLAEFYGGVCVAGFDWTLLAERIVLTGLGGELQLTAEEPELRVPNLVVTGQQLIGTEEQLSLTLVQLSGSELSGRADSLTLDLASNVVTLEQPTLLGETLLVSGDRAVLAGTDLTIDNAVATSCVCGGPPLYTVRGTAVGIDLVDGRVTVASARLQLGPLVLGLGNEIAFTTAELEDVEIPFAITFDPGFEGAAGEGLGLELPRLGLGPGVSARIDVAGLDGGHPLSGSALLRGRAPGVRVDVGVVDGGVSSEIVALQRPLPWLETELAFRNLDRANTDGLHEGLVAATVASPLPLPEAAGELALELRAFAAASSQARGPKPVSGARLGAQLDASYGTPSTPLGRGRLAARLQATTYPDQGASQLAARIAPSWTLALDPVTLSVGFERVWSDAGSPFSDHLDRLDPVSELTAALELAPRAAGIALDAELGVGYDLLAGRWSEAVAAAELELDLGAGQQLALTFDSDLLGLLLPGEDAWAEVGGRWRLAPPAGEAELGVRLRSNLVPVGIDWLDVSVAYPLVGDGAVVTPYLALDLAPLLRGEAPALSGHGVDLAWSTCCGTLLLGYRLERDRFETTLGLRLGDGQAGTMRPVDMDAP